MTSEFIPKKQKALVFQGGGSLGAYEAGVFQALYENLTGKDDAKDKPLFDIVAGTAIGAINAAILVSYFVENKPWKGSAEKLNEFWDYVSAESYADATPGFTSWWDYWSNIDDTLASGEAGIFMAGYDAGHDYCLNNTVNDKFAQQPNLITKAYNACVQNLGICTSVLKVVAIIY